MPDGGRSVGAQGKEGTAFQDGRHDIIGLLFGDDVDGSQQRRGSVNPGSGPFEHLDALDIAQVHGEIHRIMPGLRVGDVDAVKQDRDLVVGAAADADVGLHAHGAALADIYAQRVFEQVVDGLCRRGGDRHAVHQGDDARAAVERYGNARGRDGHAVNGIGFLC